jgi:hypothetical protein
MGLLSETNDVTALGFLFLIGGIVGIILGGPLCAFFPIIGLIMIAVGITYNPLKKKEDESKRYCPDCGRAIPFDAVICSYCGTKFSNNMTMNENRKTEKFVDEISNMSNDRNTKTCSFCGTENKPVSKFCKKCGKELSE